MAANADPGTYRLTLTQRIFLALLYCIAACLWLPDLHALQWAPILQGIAGLAFLVAASGWLLSYQRRRLTQYSAWISILAIPVLIILLITESQWRLGLLLGLMPLFFILSGAASYCRQPEIAGIPTTRCDWVLALKLALDEVMLGYFVTASSTPSRRRVPVIGDEVHQALEVMEQEGWLSDPDSFHLTPQEPTAVEMEEKTALGLNYQALRFPSQYQAHPELPGSDRWMAYEATHTVRARLFEHKEGDRPWLMCIHGYRMGWTYMDFQLFSPAWLHHKLGFNLIMPLLPLHGHRKEGFRSGDGFFEGELLNLLHAEAQAQSDLRACIHWLRHQRQIKKLGVYGISLGGLNASLLSSLESGIDSVIAGIPLVDPARVFELNAPRRLVKGFEKNGVTPALIRTLLKPVSPLQLQSQIPVEARAIVAGSYDRIVPLEPILALQAHWQNCQLHWYGGTHLSVRREPEVHRWLQNIWRSRGLLDARQSNQNQYDSATR